MYNFEVAGTHTYFVGKSRAWVHNADCGPDDWKNVPRKNGKWEKDADGNYGWLSEKKNVQDITGGAPVPYKVVDGQGYPDFSKWAKETFKDVDGLTGSAPGDRSAGLRAMTGSGRPEWKTQELATQWLRSNDLRVHHVPGTRSLQLVPRPLHSLSHRGGASQIRDGNS